MIIVRSPLRITLGGGGTDLPSYYRQHGGFCLSAAIDKYVYVTVIKPFKPGIYLKYSKIEQVEKVDQVEHPIIMEVLNQELHELLPRIEITTLADIPAGTGLGSSSAFTTALLRAMHTYNKEIVSTDRLAHYACHIEITRLHQPIGKQDQYASAFGGLTCFKFQKNGQVEVNSLRMTGDLGDTLQDNLLLFFTGFSRFSSDVLADQDRRTKSMDAAMLDNLHRVKERGLQSFEAIVTGHFGRFAEIMHEHWLEKRERSKGMSNPQIDAWYALARENGAIGGKLIGAGGGGFLMFYAEEGKAALRAAMRKAGLPEVRFHFDYEGTKVIAQ